LSILAAGLSAPAASALTENPCALISKAKIGEVELRIVARPAANSARRP